MLPLREISVERAWWTVVDHERLSSSPFPLMMSSITWTHAGCSAEGKVVLTYSTEDSTMCAEGVVVNCTEKPQEG
jgi:hypothetical protein